MPKNKTRALLLEHKAKYPKAEIQDVFKFIFQSACGCEHLVSDRERAINYIRAEYAAMTPCEPKIDALDGDYSRVYLSCINEKFTAEDLGALFLRSAKIEPDGKAKIEEKLSVVRELVLSGELDFPLCEFDRLVAEWKSLGFPAIHHSDRFREEYHPAYRVIHNDLLGEIEWKTK